MGVKNIAFGSGNGNQEIDVIDIGALVLLPIAASLIFQVFSWQIQVFGGYDFTAALWTLGGIDVSAAFLITLAGVGWIVTTNIANDSTDMGQYEMAAVVTALGLPILYELVPVVYDLVMWHDLTQLLAVMYVSAAAVYVSYVG